MIPGDPKPEAGPRAGIAILGGTFDPVHLGHLYSAEALYERLPVREVRLVPSRTPPHRPAPCASAADRLQMLALALAGQSRVIADDIEIRREGTSYTYDTLAALRSDMADAPLVFVLGQDAFDKLYEWYRWRELTELAHLAVLKRPGYEDRIPAPMRDWAAGRIVRDAGCLASQASGRVWFTALEQYDVSASLVRELLARGDDVSALLPAAVAEYIRQNQLYTAGGRVPAASGQ